MGKIVYAVDTDTGNATSVPATTGEPVQGPQGEDGKSAYELAVENGYQGTEQAWLNSLKGEKGDKGDTGNTGPQGIQGAQGIQGPQGQTGSDGAEGPQGETGPQGNIGPQGIQGNIGPAGPKGDTGDPGIQGPQGDPGPTDWNAITNKPATFTPSSHTHETSEVSGLDTALAGKSATTHNHNLADLTEKSYNSLTNKPTIPAAHGDLANVGTNTHAQIDSHIANTSNPHSVTKTQLGLGNVENTSDANKPVSTAQQAALDLKAALVHTHTKAQITDFGHSHTIGEVTNLQESLDAIGDPFLFKGAVANNVSTAANVNPVDVTGLVFTYEADSVYIIEIYGSTQAAAATTGIGLQFNLSSAVTRISLSFVHQLANTGTLSGGSSIADDVSVGVSSGRPSTNTDTPFQASGFLKTGANTGTAQLRFRSEVAAVATLMAGTAMRVQKVT